MTRPILPFSIGTEEPKLPLSPPPYNDRTVIHELDTSTEASNYKYRAFRPGYPLQAAELSEVQTYLYMEQTLFAFMVNAWGAFSGEPFAGSPDEGTDRRYAGPGWSGTTPVSPYNNVQYVSLSTTGAGATVLDPLNYPALFNDIPDLVRVVDNGDSLTVTFKEGYYFSEIKTGVSQVDNGFKYMIYLNDFSGAYTLTIPKEESGVTTVGFTMSQKYVLPSDDLTLNDNSSGFYNDVANGAARVQISFQEIAAYGEGSSALFPPQVVSSVLYIDHGEGQVRYMNGLPVYIENSASGDLSLGTYGT